MTERSLDASVTSSVDRLGFALPWRADPVASVGRGRVSLMLRAGDRGSASTWVSVATDDADTRCAEFAGRGARRRIPMVVARVSGHGP